MDSVGTSNKRSCLTVQVLYLANTFPGPITADPVNRSTNIIPLCLFTQRWYFKWVIIFKGFHWRAVLSSVPSVADQPLRKTIVSRLSGWINLFILVTDWSFRTHFLPVSVVLMSPLLPAQLSDLVYLFLSFFLLPAHLQIICQKGNSLATCLTTCKYWISPLLHGIENICSSSILLKYKYFTVVHLLTKKNIYHSPPSNTLSRNVDI